MNNPSQSQILSAIKLALLAKLSNIVLSDNEGNDLVSSGDMLLIMSFDPQTDEIVVKDAYPGTIHGRFKLVSFAETAAEKAKQRIFEENQRVAAEQEKFRNESPKMLIDGRSELGYYGKAPITRKVSVPLITDAMFALMHGGNKIHAIKLYREKTGMGLADSKDACEQGYKMIISERAELCANTAYLSHGDHVFHFGRWPTAERV
jgi:ribosomal protein L7/L12